MRCATDRCGVSNQKLLQVIAMNDQRRFPIPWCVEDIGAAYVVEDNNGSEA
jgi:hypothetical protein